MWEGTLPPACALEGQDPHRKGSELICYGALEEM